MLTKLHFHLPIISLSILGLVVIFSVAPNQFISQLIFVLIGLGLYFYLQRQDTAIFANLGPYFYVFSLILLGATLIFGQNIRGATRWLTLGSFRLQTSEIAKPLLIMSYANFLSRWKPINFKNILLNAILAFIPIFLIFLQPDLGTATIHFFIWLTMLFVAGLPTVYIFLIGLFLAIGVYLAPHLLHPYQLERLLTFLEPQRDPLGTGYNVIQATITIGSGRLWGRGLGRGTQAKLHFLPERHTDFVFASLAEEFGFLGVVFLFGLFGWLILHLLAICRQALNPTSKLIIIGSFAYLFFQTSLNLAMNLGLAPVTGVTLPLISYGGSSLLATYITLGIAISSLNRLQSKPSLEIK